MALLRWLIRDDTTNVHSNLLGKSEIDGIQNLDISLIHNRIVAMVEFEGDGIDEVLLLVSRERIEEQLCLVKVLLEFCAADALFYTFHLCRKSAARVALESERHIISKAYV